VAGSWNREGSLGLTRAFRLAGARAVIASQWAVEDDATCEWMTALHRARAAGATAAGDALQQASREVLRARRSSGRSIHPYYWAAFTATGD
jgi:CHAT domain-containing protein